MRPEPHHRDRNLDFDRLSPSTVGLLQHLTDLGYMHTVDGLALVLVSTSLSQTSGKVFNSTSIQCLATTWDIMAHVQSMIITSERPLSLPLNTLLFPQIYILLWTRINDLDVDTLVVAHTYCRSNDHKGVVVRCVVYTLWGEKRCD